MKKVSLFAIATGIVLIIIALVWSGFSWHRIHDDVQRIGREDYTNKQATFESSSIQNIKVNVDDVSVTIKTRADANHVTVTYSQSKTDKFKVTGSNGTVSVSRADTAAHSRDGLCIFRCVGNPDPITIYVPAQSVYGYDLTANDAPVAFNTTDILQTRTVHVVSSDSSVQLQNLSTDGPLSLTSSNGSIRLQSVKASGTIGLISSDASNVLLHVQAPSITSRTDNGSATLDSVTTQNLTVNTSDASIVLNRLVATHISLTSDNGGISGTIAGSKDDYDSKISSDNGGIWVDGVAYNGAYFSNGGKPAKSLIVKASDASVTITFVK